MHNLIANIPAWAVIGPIYLLWLITLTVVVERFIFFRRRKLGSDFIEQLNSRLEADKWHDAEKMCLVENSPAAQSLLPAFGVMDESGADLDQDQAQERSEQIDAAVKMAGSEQISLLEKNLAVLSTVATIAPLFGLLGTVTGMLKSFYFLSQQSSQSITAKFAAGIASGITEALLTTFLGLVVAIPAYIFYNYFIRRIDGFAQEMTRAYYVFRSKAQRPLTQQNTSARK